MPIDPIALRVVLMRRATQRLLAGARMGADHLCDILKASVSHPTNAGDERGPSDPGMFQWHPEKYKGNVPQWAGGSPLRRNRRRNGVLQARIGDPPYMRTGDGRDSIGFQIMEVDYDAGRIVVRIGVDATARDASNPYMLFHEVGIHYPTIGPAKGTGPLLQRPWLRPGIVKYWDEFGSVVIMVGRGLA